MEQQRTAFKESVFGYSWKNMNKHISENGTTHLEGKLKLAVQYIEQQCNAKYGFFTEVSKDDELCNSTTAIPNIYDSALLVDVLKNAGVSVSTEVTNCICKLLLQQRAIDGSWNYFHTDYNILPNDIDTSSEAALALLSCGFEKKVIEQMAAIVCHKAVIHEDGLLDVYMEKKAITEYDNSVAIYNWPVVRRVDVSIIANFLYLQNIVGNDRLPKLNEAYALLISIIDAFYRKDYSNYVITSYIKHYEKLDVICFYISRLVRVSDFCRDYVKEKLTSVIMDNSHNRNSDTISIACRILAGINCDLLEKKEGRDMISSNVQKLLDLQDNDFSFRKSSIYNAHGQFYFGSKALSTAFAVAAITSVTEALPFNYKLSHFPLT